MLACYWIYSGLPIANPIRFDHIMDFKHLNLSALSVIYLSLAGIEITAAHIANVDNPKKTYPIVESGDGYVVGGKRQTGGRNLKYDLKTQVATIDANGKQVIKTEYD